MSSAPILLCRDLAFVGASGQIQTLPWHAFDASYLNAELAVDLQVFETGTLRLFLLTSTDGALETTVLFHDFTASGPTVIPILSGLQMLVALRLRAQGATTRASGLWVSLQPKCT